MTWFCSKRGGLLELRPNSVRKAIFARLRPRGNCGFLEKASFKGWNRNLARMCGRRPGGGHPPKTKGA